MTTFYTRYPSTAGTGITSINGDTTAAQLIVGGTGISVATAAGTTTITNTAPGTGTVTSVDVSGGATGLTTSGGPITTSGTITIAGTLAIGSGGTGQVTAAAAFGALSPLTTKGDILGYSTLNARVPVGTNGQVLTADSAQTLGLKWATPTTGTVTSIDVSGGSTGLTFSGGPITSSGTITMGGGPLAVTFGGTGTATQFTAGSVVFAGASGVYTQDNANFFWDDTNNFLGIGTSAPAVELHVATSSAADPRGVMSAQYSTDTLGARFQLRKARGTVTSPTTIVTGDVLGRVRFSGYDGSNYLQMGSIEVGSSGTVASTRIPTYMMFSTATNAAPSVITEAMRITNQQFVGINVAAPGAQLEVDPSSASVIGVIIKGFTSQSSDLQAWQNSAGTNLARVQSDGTISSTTGVAAGRVNPVFGTVQKLLVNQNNTTDNSATAQINSAATGNKGLVVQGFTGQTANLFETQTSAGAVVASIGPSSVTVNTNPILGLAQTWNGSGVTFTGIKLNITDTASASASLLMDLQVGGSSIFNIAKGGNITTASSVSVSGPSAYINTLGAITLRHGNGDDVRIQNNSSTIAAIGFYNSSTVQLTQVLAEATDVLAQRRGTNAQTLRTYNTFTDSSNYERGSMGWAANQFVVATENAGTGTSRDAFFGVAGNAGNCYLMTQNSGRWKVIPAGSFLANTDNVYDIGANGANRPRDLYVAGNGTFGGTVTCAGFTSTGTVSAVGIGAIQSVVAVSSNVTLTDKAIHFVDTSGARSLQLPSPQTTRFIVIKDSTGNAATNNITIVRFASEKIETVAANYVLNTTLVSTTIVSNGTDWFLI